MEIAGIGINMTEQVGSDDMLIWVPIVPDGREGNVVFARTRRPGDPDEGEKVAVDPDAGETLRFKSGAVEISIGLIDDRSERGADGFAPISNTLWTWLVIGTPLSPQVFQHLLATGRRLDGTHILLSDVLRRMDALSGDFIRRRAQVLEAFALAEILVVALGRTADLAERIRDDFKVKTPLPAGLSKNIAKIRAIRNAFEHIEDRAKGQVRGRPHADAFTVFNQEEFARDRALSYGKHRLSLPGEVAPLLLEIRRFLFDVAVEFAGPARRLYIPVDFFKGRETDGGQLIVEPVVVDQAFVRNFYR